MPEDPGNWTHSFYPYNHYWEKRRSIRSRVGLPLPKNCPIKAKHYYMLKEYWDGHLYMTKPRVVYVVDVKSLYRKMGHKANVVYFVDLCAEKLFKLGKMKRETTLTQSCELDDFIDLYKEVRESEAKEEVSLTVLSNL